MRFNHKSSPAEKIIAAAKGDAMSSTLRDMTSAEVDDWLQTNITSVPDVREALKSIFLSLQALQLRNPL